MNLLKIEMPPFTRTLWVSPKAKEVWEPRIRLAAQAYWSLEKETVKNGLRRCTTAHVSPDQLPAYSLELAKQGLVFLPRLKVGSYNGFAHKHPPVEKGKPWNWYGPVANSIEAAKEFVEAEQAGNHRAIGDLLGYPKCCQEFFSTVWTAGYVDPIWQAAINTNAVASSKTSEYSTIVYGPSLPLTWSGSRYNGLRIAAHIPCSYSCEKTRSGSARWVELGRTLRLPGLSELIDLLNMPTSWDCLHGIAQITTPIYRLVTNSTPCHPRYVVRKHGEFIPEYAAKGNQFPFVS